MTRLAAAAVLVCCLQGCAPQHYMFIQAEQLTLVLQAPEAKQVRFASSLDEYYLHTPAKNKDGKWIVKVPSQREFQYFYMVDGELFLPECRFKQADDFGTFNCRYLP